MRRGDYSVSEKAAFCDIVFSWKFPHLSLVLFFVRSGSPKPRGTTSVFSRSVNIKNHERRDHEQESVIPLTHSKDGVRGVRSVTSVA
ncbi:hypothetical protein BaRGS_00021675 [Batillaria attramentaria]|uniref:Uncharacterized protein n=1 Tax=Batillaria attramentaria TaxID=370345 RepID=A0ABD0KIK1_9CAEN